MEDWRQWHNHFKGLSSSNKWTWHNWQGRSGGPAAPYHWQDQEPNLACRVMRMHWAGVDCSRLDAVASAAVARGNSSSTKRTSLDDVVLRVAGSKRRQAVGGSIAIVQSLVTVWKASATPDSEPVNPDRFATPDSKRDTSSECSMQRSVLDNHLGSASAQRALSAQA